MIVLAAALSCFAAAKPIEAGSPVVAGAVRACDCRDETPAPLRFDRALRGPVALAPIQAGDYLGALSSLPERAVRRGTALVLRAAAGPIVIERAVTALQNARSGERVFVRDAAGKVFAARLALTEPMVEPAP